MEGTFNVQSQTSVSTSQNCHLGGPWGLSWLSTANLFAQTLDNSCFSLARFDPNGSHFSWWPTIALFSCQFTSYTENVQTEQCSGTIRCELIGTDKKRRVVYRFERTTRGGPRVR